MKKSHLLLLFILLSIRLFAQRDFTQVDELARKYRSNTKDYKALAQDLTAPFDNETDKARAIYVWITDNIRYDCQKIHKRAKGKSQKKPIQFRSEAEKQQKLAERKVEYMTTTLKKKKGVCEDYALLFQEMCSAVGIKAEFVTGHQGQGTQSLGKVPKLFNHAWNSVQLEGKWYLVDATAGAGNVEGNCKKFTKNFNSGLFMTEPEDMILSHFPDKTAWQYLEQPITKEAFANLPVPGGTFYHDAVIDYFPKGGIINAKENKIVEFKIKFAKDQRREMKLSVNNQFQPGLFKQDQDGYWVYSYPLKKRRNKTMSIFIKNGVSGNLLLSFKSK